MKTRKGISPLIATVLLIGFTVALAAVLMTWGLDYIRDTTEKVGSQTEQYLQCSSSDFAFEITKVNCNTNEITVQNNGNIDIAGIILRIFVGSDIIAVMRVQGIPAYASNPYPATLAGATKVEAIAEIKGSGNSNITCKDNIKEFTASC